MYHSNLRPIPAGDSVPASLIPFAILLDGTIALDRYVPHIHESLRYSVVQSGGHWYSMYPIAGPVLATPLYFPIVLLPRNLPPATLFSIAQAAEKYAAVVLTATTAIVLLLLLRLVTSERAAWMLTLVFAFGTNAWATSSQALWQHTYGLLPIAGCLYAIARLSAGDAPPRWCWIAGLCAACALAVRPTNISLLPVLALVLWLERARMADFIRAFVPPALAGAAVAALNLVLFHRAAGPLYSTRLDGNVVDGLLGVLFSPARGLLFYTPVAIFALAAFVPRARPAWRRHKTLVLAASAFVLLHLALVAAWPMWWGGHAWGPRLLTEILVPLMILIAVGLSAIRNRGTQWAFAAVAVYGCLTQAVGVYCYPKGGWDYLPVNVDSAPERLWDWKDNPLIRSARAGVMLGAYWRLALWR